jgi:hypothetical protein
MILAELGGDSVYAYGFGVGSHFVHGDWLDLKWHHLERVKGRYNARWAPPTPDPRGVCPATILSLSILLAFIKWNRSDPNHFVEPIIRNVLEVTQHLEDAHERSLHR